MKLAPFSKPLKALQIEHSQPKNDVYLFIGENSWDKASNSSIIRPSRTLCLPPNSSPFEYEWPVKLCDILIFDTGRTDEELVRNIAAALFHAGALIIRYVSCEGDVAIFKRDF